VTASPVPSTAVVGVSRGNFDRTWFTEIHETDRLDHLTACPGHPGKMPRGPRRTRSPGPGPDSSAVRASSADRSFIF
jgi:hypothetical protein